MQEIKTLIYDFHRRSSAVEVTNHNCIKENPWEISAEQIQDWVSWPKTRLTGLDV